MKKILVLTYGVLAYVMFMAVFVYTVGFIGNFGISNSLDALPSKPLFTALIINVFLFTLFGLQHSGMARKGFKRWLTTYIPKAVERSTYIIFSNIALMIVMYFWEPIGGIIWYFESQFSRQFIIAIYMFGWFLVLISSFLINHFHLFGLQQTWEYFSEKKLTNDNFVTPWLYTIIRHPLYLGWFVIVWAAPTMTVTHLLFALSCTIYIFIGIRFEEKDLVEDFGDSYLDYQSKVPMLIPGSKLSQSNDVAVKGESA